MAPNGIGAPTMTPTPLEDLQRQAQRQAIAQGLMLLASRIIVLVSVTGGIGLTVLALGQPDPFRLGALAIYAGAIVCPSIWLASRR